MARTIARLLAESLEAHDVDQVYCVPGESYVGLTSALIERNSIRVVVCRHEGGAGYMAVADGRLRDRAGVAMVSRGPGLSNAMVSLHSAYHDATPVLMLVGGALLGDALHDKAVFADLNRFAEEWILPISPTHRRPQLFDATHPNFGGYMGIRVPPALIGEMKRADLMVALGERMTDTVSQSYTFPTAPQPQLPLVHIWPDPNEVGRVWRPDLGIPCSPHEVVKGLLRLGAPADAGKRSGWVNGL